MKRLYTFATCLAILAVSACTNTFEGFGQDMNNTGKAIGKGMRNLSDRISGTEGGSGDYSQDQTEQTPYPVYNPNETPHKDTPYYDSNGQPIGGSAQEGY